MGDEPWFDIRITFQDHNQTRAPAAGGDELLLPRGINAGTLPATLFDTLHLDQYDTMGMNAIPFAVDINKVKAVFGCKDRSLLEQIKKADLYDNYASQDDALSDSKYHYSLDEAIEDILFKYIPPSERKPKRSFLGLTKSKPSSGLDERIAYGYGYALLVICDHFGTYLLPQCDGFYYGRDFNTAFEIMKQHGLQLDLGDMFEQHAVFDIPKIKDFPAIKLFTRSEISEINDVMSNIEIDESKTGFDNDDFDEVQDMLNNIRHSFNYCEQHDLDMITFTH